MILTPPLKKMRLTQPYGVDWTGVGLYKRLGMRGHNGWDLHAPDGTEVYAAIDGEAYVEVEAPVVNLPPTFTSGYGINVRIRHKILNIELVYGHLKNTLIKNGDFVSAGQLIATADNTGISSGSHLHFGVRRIEYRNGAGPYILDYDNGYFGYVDPAMFFPDDVFDLPVDRGYRLNPVSIFEFAPAMLYFIKSQKRLPSFREYKALRWGRWDLRAVLDPAMFPVWSEFSKFEAIKNGLVKRP